MQGALDLWAAYGSTVGFAMVNTLFALSAFAALSTGVLSFSTVVYAAVGGFLSAQMVAKFGMPLPAAFLLAIVAGAAAAALVSAAFLRLESHWIALSSLALILIARVTVLNVPTLTGGVNGLFVPQRLAPLALAGVLVVCCLVFWRLDRSWYGLAARAVREDAVVASTIGMNPRAIQWIGALVSGGVGGAAGAALAFTLQFVSADTYFIGLAFTMIASTVLGGSFHWLGPIVGAAVFTALPALMQSVLPQIEDVARGVALLLIMIFMPRGIVDPRAAALRRAARARAEPEALAASGRGPDA